jgi:ligand-binding sensor domain-containing protein/DNA-binding CsgD family transcriptional regulator
MQFKNRYLFKVKLMILNFKYFFILLLLLKSFGSYSQVKNIGLPSIVNHSRNEYHAGTQNWNITQSKNGFIYLGNNDGILEFDGTTWTTYPVPNSSVVRSVLAVGDTIYSGAFEEIGYLAPDRDGRLTYYSLNHLIPSVSSGIDEIWNIYEYHGKIIFQSYNYIFILSGEEVRIIEPLSRFSMLHLVNDQFYVVDKDHGLMLLENDSLKLVSHHPIFFRNEVRNILPLDNGALLIGTSNDGLFLLNRADSSITPWDTDVNRLIEKDNLFSAIRLSNGSLAFGSVSNGIYLSNQEGQILQHINRYKGLQNNTILSLYEDRRNNLWLGLDNGIDYLEISSPITILNYSLNIESAYSSLVHNGILYVGTNQGLYAGEYSGNNYLYTDFEGFQLIRGTEGQVWSLDVIDNTLFSGHDFGCFVIDGFTARQISDIRGYWTFLMPPGRSETILAGTYQGLVSLKKDMGQWVFYGAVKGFGESSRSMYMDTNDNLWISHGYRGLFKLNLNSSLDSVISVQLFRSESGLPDQLPYNIQVINSEMYITTQTGILRYNYTTNTFSKPDNINRIFEGKGFIDRIYQDNNGNLWYFTNNYLGVMRLLENGNYIDILSPFAGINELLIPAFQNIYVHDSYNVFIGSQEGLIHYTPNIIKDYSIAEEVFIKEATFYGKNNESTSWFISNLINITDHEARIVPYSGNSVMFRFTTPAFEDPGKSYFSYRLLGFDPEWTDWTGINFKEYTNLREGSYTFQIRSVNAYSAESTIRSFHFTVKPPLLRSRVAYFFYSLILGSIIIGNFLYFRKRILKTRTLEKIKHEKRLAQREEIFREQTALSEKEIVYLRNESLKKEMKFKNKELANATLHLIQKNKTLSYLKEDLQKLIKSNPANNPAKDNINSLIKKIDRDLRNEKNWELFNNYFDEVHQDFTNRLKDQYEDLSPKELRLCAYLRMNISTKEIAPLMNISVRGVEISRYRLRKKLKLDHNTNLTEFILNF